MKEELIRQAKRELNRQIHSTLNDWTQLLGSEDIIDHLGPYNLKRPQQPITKLPIPQPLQPFNLHHLEHARAHIVNQLNFQLSIKQHMEQGQVFSEEQIKNYAPRYQDLIDNFKTKLEPKIQALNRDELEEQGVITDMEVLKRYLAQDKLSLSEIKHKLEQRKLNKLLQ